MGLVGKVAGKVLGPRPGLAIVSFWGGRIEIILRILALLLGSLPALISAAVVLGTLEGIDEIGDEWRDKIYAATGVVIGVAGLAIIIEVVIIILRFLNIGVINLKIKIFLIIMCVTVGVMVAVQPNHISSMTEVIAAIFTACLIAEDIILSFVLAGGHIVGGVLQAYYGDEFPESIDDAKTIKPTMTCACAVFCFIAAVLFVILAIFMIIYLVKDWNNKVVKATLKEAVTG